MPRALRSEAAGAVVLWLPPCSGAQRDMECRVRDHVCPNMAFIEAIYLAFRWPVVGGIMGWTKWGKR